MLHCNQPMIRYFDLTSHSHTAEAVNIFVTDTAAWSFGNAGLLRFLLGAGVHVYHMQLAGSFKQGVSKQVYGDYDDACTLT